MKKLPKEYVNTIRKVKRYIYKKYFEGQRIKLIEGFIEEAVIETLNLVKSSKPSHNNSSKKDCYSPCINNQDNKCKATPEHLIPSCGLRKRSPS